MTCIGTQLGRIAVLRASLIALALTLIPFSATAQWEPAFVLESPEPESSGEFGYSVSGVPDVNGDGVWDIVVGAYGESPGDSPAYAGRVHLFSGATGGLLRTLSPPDEQQSGQFGFSVAGSCDLNADGFGDVIVGAPSGHGENDPYRAGCVHVFSGATGALIRTIVSPGETSLGGFGLRVQSTADLSGDGVADFLVTSQRVDVDGVIHYGGWVHLISGFTGEIITEFGSLHEEINGWFGTALSDVPDVNGDGVGEILIGARYEDRGSSLYNAGRVYLFSVVDGSLIREIQSPHEQSHGLFGSSVSSFDDIDGDGICDLAVGAPSETDSATLGGRGYVHLFSGASGDPIESLRPDYPIAYSGFGTALDHMLDINGDGRDELAIGALGRNEVFLFSGATATQMMSHRSDEGGEFGASLARLPDLNGDGRDDLAVGAPSQGVDTIKYAGRVHIFHTPQFPRFYPEIELSANRFDIVDQLVGETLSFSLSIENRGTADLNFTGSGVTIGGLTPGDFHFIRPPEISPLAPGMSRDLDLAFSPEHTGFKAAEIVITTDDHDEPELRIPISAVATHPDAIHPEIPSSSLLSINGYGAALDIGDFHFDLAHGDVNGDGHDDLVAGYPNIGAYPLNFAAGAVSVVYGQGGMSGTSLNLSYEGVPSERETRFLGPNATTFLGWAVASGDINGDGFDDVVMGAPREDAAAGLDAGKVFIVYGRETLPGEAMLFAVPPGVYGETQIHGFQGGEYIGETLGGALTVADFDADGFDDVAIGAPWSSPWTRRWAGRVYVVWGGPDLPGRVIDLHDGVGAHGETRIIGEWFEDNLGEELASGDVDGDGLDDLIIGARMGDPLGRTDAGRAYIVYGSAMVPGLEIDLRSATDHGAITHILGAFEGAQAAESVACGDVNADGLDDVLVGASLASPEGVAGAGEVFVIWGAADLHGGTIDLRSSGAEARIVGSESNARAGSSIGIVDLSGDGHEDIVVSNRHLTIWGLGVLWGESIAPGERINLRVANAWRADDTRSDPSRIASAGGDLDRDGFTDSSRTIQNSNRRSHSLFGRGFARSATATEWFRAGQAPWRGIGGRLSPVLRTHISFDGGDGPTPVTVTLTRSNDSIENLDPGPLAGLVNATWEITTPRVGYYSSNVTLQYTDRELGTLIEDSLRLFQAPSPSGPWTEVATQQLNTHRNEILGVVGAMGHFAILGDYPTGGTGMSSEGIVEHLLGLIPEAPGMDTNDDGRVDASDLIRNLNDIAGVGE